MINKIITHPGAAHRDEFYAIALLLNQFPVVADVTIERRDPTPEELEDTEVVVLDIGGSLDPMLNNYDHHQDGELSCSAHLIAEAIGINDALKIIYPWWPYMSDWDTKGPVYCETTYGVSSSPILISGIEKAALMMFVENPNSLVTKGFLEFLGDFLINGLRLYESQSVLFDNGTFIDVEDLVLFTADAENTFFDTWLRNQGKTCHMTVFNDDRGPGLTLYRYEEFANRVNLYLLDGNDLIAFAHANGFLAKTTRKLNIGELLELLKGALI